MRLAALIALDLPKLAGIFLCVLLFVGATCRIGTQCFLHSSPDWKLMQVSRFRTL